MTTILLLEPDIIVRAEVGDLLRHCGYRVIEGVTADDAHVVLESGTRVDVVLAEVALGGNVGGFELSRELRQRRAEIVVILVSGSSDLAEKASDLCGRGPTKKPYRPEDLLTRIQAQLDQRRELLRKVVGDKD